MEKSHLCCFALLSARHWKWTRESKIEFFEEMAKKKNARMLKVKALRVSPSCFVSLWLQLQILLRTWDCSQLPWTCTQYESQPSDQKESVNGRQRAKDSFQSHTSWSPKSMHVSARLHHQWVLKTGGFWQVTSALCSQTKDKAFKKTNSLPVKHGGGLVMFWGWFAGSDTGCLESVHNEISRLSGNSGTKLTGQCQKALSQFAGHGSSNRILMQNTAKSTKN